jgi:SAM-dependent methyltransferase
MKFGTIPKSMVDKFLAELPNRRAEVEAFVSRGYDDRDDPLAIVDQDAPLWDEFVERMKKDRPANGKRGLLPSWGAAKSYALSKLSTLGGVKVTRLPVMQQRATSCFGRMYAYNGPEPCPALAYSNTKRFHYCNDCECGERDDAKLSKEGSPIDRPIVDDLGLLKYGYPYLECPRGRPGFSNEADDLTKRRDAERERYIELLKAQPNYGRRNHGAGAVDRVVSWRPEFVVDFGCGGNEFIRELRRRGVDGSGIDWAGADADLIAPMHDVKKLRDGIADVITSFDALEHLLPEDVEPVLREMRRVAKPGARFIFSISTRASSYAGVRNLHRTVQPRGWWIKQIEKVADVTAGRESSAPSGKPEPVAGERAGYIEGVFRA